MSIKKEDFIHVKQVIDLIGVPYIDDYCIYFDGIDFECTLAFVNVGQIEGNNLKVLKEVVQLIRSTNPHYDISQFNQSNKCDFIIAKLDLDTESLYSPMLFDMNKIREKFLIEMNEYLTDWWSLRNK